MSWSFMARTCRILWAALACIFVVPVMAQPENGTGLPSDVLDQAPPAVQQAVQTAWSKSPALRAAQARLQAAQARSRAAARPLYNPEIELTAERADVDTRSVGLSQTLDWSGKRRARADVGTAELRAAEAGFDRMRLEIGLQWLGGYAAFQVAGEQVALGGERVRILTQFESLAQRRFAAGDIPSLERDLATLALQESRAQQAELVADWAQAQRRLTAIGGDVERLPDLPRNLPLPAALPVADALIDTLPAVRQSRAETEVAAASITVAQRQRRADPTVSVSTGRVTQGVFRDNLIGVTVRIPLFVRNTYRDEVSAALADADEAQAALSDQRLRAVAQANEAGTAYNALREAWMTWESSRASRFGERAALLQRLWEAGELSTADYVVQLKQSIDTELTAASLRARVWQAWADWLGASGQLVAWLTPAAAPTDQGTNP